MIQDLSIESTNRIPCQLLHHPFAMINKLVKAWHCSPHIIDARLTDITFRTNISTTEPMHACPHVPVQCAYLGSIVGTTLPNPTHWPSAATKGDRVTAGVAGGGGGLFYICCCASHAHHVCMSKHVHLCMAFYMGSPRRVDAENSFLLLCFGELALWHHATCNAGACQALKCATGPWHVQHLPFRHKPSEPHKSEHTQMGANLPGYSDSCQNTAIPQGSLQAGIRCRPTSLPGAGSAHQLCKASHCEKYSAGLLKLWPAQCSEV